MDGGGALLLTAGTVALLYGVIGAPQLGWGSWQVTGSLGLGVVLLAAFVLAGPAPSMAQGVVRGAQEGAAVGNRAAGPVGGVVGGAVGGVFGGVAAVSKGCSAFPRTPPPAAAPPGRRARTR